MVTAVRIQNDVAKLEKMNGKLTKNLYYCQMYTRTLIYAYNLYVNKYICMHIVSFTLTYYFYFLY